MTKKQLLKLLKDIPDDYEIIAETIPVNDEAIKGRSRYTEFKIDSDAIAYDDHRKVIIMTLI